MQFNSPTSWEYNTHRRRDSTGQLSRQLRQCVLNLQLVHYGFGIFKNSTEHAENLSRRVGCRIGKWATTDDGWVGIHTTRHNSTRLYMTSFPFFSVGSRRELVANLVHTPRSRRDSTRQSSRVGDAGCIGLHGYSKVCDRAGLWHLLHDSH